jgi:hypothetical protein
MTSTSIASTGASPLPATRPARRAPLAVDLIRDLTPQPDQFTVRTMLGRSLFPIATCLILGGTLLWGPWVTLGLALALWHVVGRIG